jgi:RNA polymerase sigma-70 factor (sigma-E family)
MVQIVPETVTTTLGGTSESAHGVVAALFTGFYAEHRAGLVRLAVLLVDDRAVAEEVVQDAFAKLYERWNRAHDPLAYVRMCVVNRSRDVLRRRRLLRREATLVEAVSDAGHDHLRDAIARLPARQRAAIVLRYYADLSVEETAVVMKTRPGTVKSLVHRGVAQLRKVIER